MISKSPNQAARLSIAMARGTRSQSRTITRPPFADRATLMNCSLFASATLIPENGSFRKSATALAPPTPRRLNLFPTGLVCFSVQKQKRPVRTRMLVSAERRRCSRARAYDAEASMETLAFPPSLNPNEQNAGAPQEKNDAPFGGAPGILISGLCIAATRTPVSPVTRHSEG